MPLAHYPPESIGSFVEEYKRETGKVLLEEAMEEAMDRQTPKIKVGFTNASEGSDSDVGIGTQCSVHNSPQHNNQVKE